jgi:hypothetical protein
MLKKKILSIWVGLCYLSLTILLGACDEACCVPTPSTNLGTIFIFPDFATAQIDCQSPFFTISNFATQTSPGGIVNINDSEGSVCNDIPVWYISVRVGGTTSNNELWHKVYHIPDNITTTTLNGRVAIKVTGVPIGANRTIELTVREPKHISGSNGCTNCSSKYSIKWVGTVTQGLFADQQIFISCVDSQDTKCCN